MVVVAGEGLLTDPYSTSSAASMAAVVDLTSIVACIPDAVVSAISMFGWASREEARGGRASCEARKSPVLCEHRVG